MPITPPGGGLPAFWLHVGAGWVTRESLRGASPAGIAWVTGERQANTGRPEEVSTVGLPVELQLALRLLPLLGVGLSGVANWNPEESFAGAVLSVQVGRLR
jgi:hypothetical protein